MPVIQLPTKVRALVIDDEELVRDTLCLLLKEESCDVMGAEDAESGLELYEQSPADIVFIDVYMPRKDGIEAVREFRSRFPQSMPVVISGGGRSGYSDVLRFARRLGANLVLSKPISRVDIRAILGQIPRLSHSRDYHSV